MARARVKSSGESKTLKALFPGPTSAILCALFNEPQRWWSLQDLEEKANLTSPGLQEILSQLREGGLVREELDGEGPRFQPDRRCPVYEELRSMLTKLVIPPQGGEIILVVEDQPATAQITRILLESWSYRVLEAHSAEEAIQLFETAASEIQLLLTDVMMPDMTGPQLAEELWSRKPDLRVIFMSGYPSDRHVGRAAFLSKPFNPAGLCRVVRRELDRAARPAQRHMKPS